MNEYIQYVYNLKGSYQYEKLTPTVRDAVVSVILRKIEDCNSLECTILNETDQDVLQYISENLDLKRNIQNIILTTDSSSYVETVDFTNVRAVINLKKSNFTQHPNELFRTVNDMLPDAGIFIGSVITYFDRKIAIYRRFGRYVGFILWIADFIINRVIPRMYYLDKLYYILTNGQFHNISRSEILGRLVYCGFDIIDFKSINGISYFVTMKIKEPSKVENPSYYPIVRLSRIGRDGKMIGVYKLRTMNPYSEFLQEYMIRMNGYNDKGKPADDYRVTRWGSYMRKVWIDELPQLYNVLKGEMKLVGLRPLSQVRFNEFPEDLKKERVKYKPGCFPPYVALNMPDDKMNIEAERIYIREYNKHPYTTDIRYFLMAVYNIIMNKIRSS
jgi:lipopolysaccharide/colanic/teichoic acid biosynthesis glycosyltransferase